MTGKKWIDFGSLSDKNKIFSDIKGLATLATSNTACIAAAVLADSIKRINLR